MKIGIKYCGGCNPTYLRESIEDVVRKEFSQAQFFYTSNLAEVDVLLVICGCKTACAAKSIENMDKKDIHKVVIFNEHLSKEEVIRKILYKA